MHLDAVAVGIAYRLGQLLGGKIPREGAHPEAGARQIDGVRAIEHCHFQFFHVPRGRKQLRLTE